jgi:hypothetical protein
VTRADVRVVTADPPTFAFLIQGRGALTKEDLGWPDPRVALALHADAAVDGQCGEVWLPQSRCRAGVGGRLSCGPLRPTRPCAGDPHALTGCDARNCASAQEQFFAEHDTYFTGECGGLPGFVASPEVECITVGSPYDYTVLTTHVPTGYFCILTSNPAAGLPDLICGE